MTRSIYADPQPSDFGIERLLESEEINQLTVAEYKVYERKLKAYRDWKNTVVTAYLMKVEEGKKEQAIETARAMKADNEPIAKIMKYTELSEQEIAAL